MPRISIAAFAFLTYMLVVVAALVTITLFSLGAFRQAYFDRIMEGLATQAQAVSVAVAPVLKSDDHKALHDLCIQLSKGQETRITVILPSGHVVADSQYDATQMANHSDREEVQQALKAGEGKAIRISETLGTRMFYYAIPIFDGNQLLGVVRTSLYLDPVRVIMTLIYSRVILGAGIVGLIALTMSLAVSLLINRSVHAMVDKVKRFSQGDFSELIKIPIIAEGAVLAESLNGMAEQLNERLRAVIKGRNQQEAVLSSMIEGVIAVDNEGRVMTFNNAAIRLTGIDFNTSPNAHITTIAPDTHLARFVQEIITSGKSLESEFGNIKQGGRILQAHGSVLRDSFGNGIGAVVVFNDVTRLRRLEQVRRDFVANVSHELRTPITSIKGFVETLLDGALENSLEESRHFLGIVAKQADRLNAILSDLLTLSSIEDGEATVNISIESVKIYEILEDALQVCARKAQAKEITLKIDCDRHIRATINPSLIEQAIVNLIDNAIKYSPNGSQVIVKVHEDNGIRIEVQDFGSGIPAEHLPRLFERFYRVDKARSRSLGGTGLGLAIVKHVVTAHGGNVSVKSALGEGSTFTIFLPMN